MALNSLHVLLTYQCNYECDHCFVWGSPRLSGTFTLAQLESVFQQAQQLGSVREFYFEGGEPFLYHPILVRAVSRANELGLATGIVSNAYWATSEEDALAWLKPLADAGLDRIDLSCDVFHGDEEAPGVQHGMAAARRLGIGAGTIELEPPSAYRDPATAQPGEALAGGDIMFRGRAAELLTAPLPTQPWTSFTNCPYENLVDPGRVHLDPLGNLHLCQGLVIGNLFERPLIDIMAEYRPEMHPVVGPLLAGGPAQLARHYGLAPDDGYVDACHLCYTARAHLRPRFPHTLAPDQMYGVAGA